MQTEYGRLTEQLGSVSVWLGHADDEATWEAYLEEQYDDESSSMNDFAAEFDLGFFYDHDMQEAHFNPTGDVPIRVLLAENSYADSFLEPVIEAARSCGLEIANASVLLYGLAYSSEPCPKNTRNRIQFVGVFPYERSAS